MSLAKDDVSDVAREKVRMPGAEGVWVFVGADMAFFAVLFASFMSARLDDPALFEASRRTLNPDFGGINTLILLTSSWCVVRAVEATRKHAASAVIARWILVAFAFGLAFGVSKAIEYGGKLQAGITPQTNDFYMFYYVLTGFHLLHVTAGTVLLLVMRKMAASGAFSGARVHVLECAGLYWHMVDLLWIVLFPLLYLMR